MASNLNPATSTFTRANMLLGALDDFTSAWGSAMANNIGFLSHLPVALLNFPTNRGRESSDITNEGTMERGWFYLDSGSWRMYYGIYGTCDNSSLSSVRFPELILYTQDGTGTVVCAHGGSLALGTWTGSFLWNQEENGNIMWELGCREKDPITSYSCQISLYGIRDGLEA